MLAPTSTTTRIIPLGALAVLGLASCSMPNEQAWRQIRQEGLITYLVQDQEGQQPSASSSSQSLASASTSSAVKPAPTPTPATTAPVTNVPPPSQLAGQSLPVAQSVPGLEGYVRSPFTNPPRLVDVRGMTSGSKVVCPYTRRPFLVPNMPQAQAVASTPAPAPTPTAAPQEPAKPEAPVAPVKVAPTAPTKVAANNTTAPQPPPTPVTPQPKPTANTVPAAPTQPVKTAAAELPFGTPIAGRPGFVNSPYAAKHQLVDVTGLPTGMEVKCPYTGKLFRVPPSANGTAQ
jgi:hypothetical protein